MIVYHRSMLQLRVSCTPRHRWSTMNGQWQLAAMRQGHEPAERAALVPGRPRRASSTVMVTGCRVVKVIIVRVPLNGQALAAPILGQRCRPNSGTRGSIQTQRIRRRRHRGSCHVDGIARWLLEAAAGRQTLLRRFNECQLDGFEWKNDGTSRPGQEEE
jgi:hypothetical protein